jgi:hypothetical protein
LTHYLEYAHHNDVDTTHHHAHHHHDVGGGVERERVCAISKSLPEVISKYPWYVKTRQGMRLLLLLDDTCESHYDGGWGLASMMTRLLLASDPNHPTCPFVAFAFVVRVAYGRVVIVWWFFQQGV